VCPSRRINWERRGQSKKDVEYHDWNTIADEFERLFDIVGSRTSADSGGNTLVSVAD